MKVRGERECRDCGTRWSYYETGSVACPDCGSLRSVGVDDERERHTDAPVELDLSPYRTAVESGDVLDVADDLAADLREYVRRRGFIHGGELRRLDETYLAAQELRFAVEEYERGSRLGVERASPGSEVAELYLLRLLGGADRGDRPPVEEVPDAFASTRGLAYATAVDEYREDVSTYLDDHPDETAERALGRLRDHAKRVQALDGDVPPADAESLVRAARDLHAGVAEGDADALARVRDRLYRLA